MLYRFTTRSMLPQGSSHSFINVEWEFLPYFCHLFIYLLFKTLKGYLFGAKPIFHRALRIIRKITTVEYKTI